MRLIVLAQIKKKQDKSQAPRLQIVDVYYNFKQMRSPVNFSGTVHMLAVTHSAIIHKEVGRIRSLVCQQVLFYTTKNILRTLKIRRINVLPSPVNSLEFYWLKFCFLPLSESEIVEAEDRQEAFPEF